MVTLTLWVYRADARAVCAHEYVDGCTLYVADVVVPRWRLPRARPGDRIRWTVGGPSAAAAAG